MTRHEIDDWLPSCSTTRSRSRAGDRLGELRALTSAPSSRRWWIAAGGSALATAAAITAIAVVVNSPSPTAQPGPSNTPSGSVAEETPAPPTGDQKAVAAYFVGDTPRGPRLYREFQQVVDPPPGLAGLGLLESEAADPDYSTPWPGLVRRSSRTPRPAASTCTCGDAPPTPPPPRFPAGRLHGQRRLPGALVGEFHRGDTATDRVSAAPQLDVLSHVNLSDPSEGQVVDGHTLRVKGVANSNEANVLWTPRERGRLVRRGQQLHCHGYMEERLFPFSDTIDVSSLDPGTYTLTVETSDLSGGAEGSGPFSDTRTFVIE